MTITFLIPTLNASKYLNDCLWSIFIQSHQSDVIIIDGGSTDDTLDIARKYECKILHNPNKLAEEGIKIGIREVYTDLVVIFSSDNELVGDNWIERVESVFSLNVFSAAWGKLVSGRNDKPINQYAMTIQNDPLTWFLNPKYVWGANGLVYRTKDIKPIWDCEGYLGDNDAFQTLIEKGGKTYYFNIPFVIHHHIQSLRDWMNKWQRNTRYHLLPNLKTRNMRWTGKNFKLKLVLWLVYQPFTGIHSIYLSLRDRNIYWLYHPICCVTQTFVYTYEVIRWAICRVVRYVRVTLFVKLYARL
jgi:glycosyltransferase involved in cell wall biosynthesis